MNKKIASGEAEFESIKTQGKGHPLLFLEFLIVIFISGLK
jgi:hypothetical protein